MSGHVDATADLGREYEGVIRDARALLRGTEESLAQAMADRDMLAAAVDDQRARIASLEADLAVLAAVVRDAQEHAARRGTSSAAWESLRGILRYPGTGDALERARRLRSLAATRRQSDPRFGRVSS